MQIQYFRNWLIFVSIQFLNIDIVGEICKLCRINRNTEKTNFYTIKLFRNISVYFSVQSYLLTTDSISLSRTQLFIQKLYTIVILFVFDIIYFITVSYLQRTGYILLKCYKKLSNICTIKFIRYCLIFSLYNTAY